MTAKDLIFLLWRTGLLFLISWSPLTHQSIPQINLICRYIDRGICSLWERTVLFFNERSTCCSRDRQTLLHALWLNVYIHHTDENISKLFLWLCDVLWHLEDMPSAMQSKTFLLFVNISEGKITKQLDCFNPTSLPQRGIFHPPTFARPSSNQPTPPTSPISR